MQGESDFTFRCSDLPSRSFSFFAGLKTQEKFCDVTFTVGTRRISAHRIIVAAAIPFFQDMLSTENDEITIQHVGPGVFESLIEFAYTCELKITMENVKDLLSGAYQFRMDEVLEGCCDFLAERLHPENALYIRELATELDYPQLMEITDHYIKERFIEIYETEKFLNCSFSHIKELTGKGDLQVDSEEKVLEAVLKWVRASPDDRKADLPDLLLQVRMPLITPLYLTHLVEREELIQMSLANRDLIDEARNYNLFPQMRKDKCSFSTEPRQFTKTSTASSEDITKEGIYTVCQQIKLIIGSFDFTHNKWSELYNNHCNVVCSSTAELGNKMYSFLWGFAVEYDAVKNEIKYLAECKVPRIFTGAAALDSKIYVCGGKTGGSNFSNAVECFDPSADKWAMAKPMHRARNCPCVVSLGEYIYALGGSDNASVHDSVERYPSVTGGWQTMAPMLSGRYCAAAAVLKGSIYVCGGKSDLNGKCVRTAEVYDPFRNKWEPISSMNTERWLFTLVSLRGKLYAVGGGSVDGKFLNSCEVYDPEVDEWAPGPEIESDHHAYGAFAM